MSSVHEDDSVLAHLVFGRGVGLKPEDATTEALVYVLNRSEAVRRRLHELVSSVTGLPLAPVQRYETQVQQAENQRPDIVGYSATNQQVLLIENKFWADLTDNQPVAYLRVLESDEPGIVLFVCPSTRLDLLWTYLLDRVNMAAIIIDNKTDDSTRINDPRSILLQRGHHALGCISWNRLLRELRQAAQDANVGTLGMQSVLDYDRLMGQQS
ncbi:MAG: PD-(D/E)XK nuclease family protein [Pseudomonadota bacterium]